jgi:hypothetical protein
MKNKSKTYLAPLVLNDYSFITFSEIVDTFLYLETAQEEPVLFLACDKTIPIDELIYYPEVFKIYELDNFYLIGINIPEKYNYEYLCFKNGKYSYYRPFAKEIIINYLYRNTNSRSRKVVDKVVDIFSRNPMLKEHLERMLEVKLDKNVELASKPDLAEETFNSAEYGKYKEIKKTNINIPSEG